MIVLAFHESVFLLNKIIKTDLSKTKKFIYFCKDIVPFVITDTEVAIEREIKYYIPIVITYNYKYILYSLFILYFTNNTNHNFIRNVHACFQVSDHSIRCVHCLKSILYFC